MTPTLTKLALGTAISSLSLMVAYNPAQAALLGNTVRGQLFSFLDFEPVFAVDQTVTVIDPGTEFISNSDRANYSLDVKNNSLDITHSFFFRGGVFPLVWTLSALPPGITGVTLTSGDASLITGTSFTNNSITILLASYRVTPRTSNTWSFAIQSKTASVPEPLTILGTGTAIGFGAVFRRKLAKKQSKNS